MWVAICSILKKENLLSKKYYIDENGSKTRNQIEKFLNSETNFEINNALFSFSFGGVGAAKLHQLIITQEEISNINWDIWVRELSNYGQFIYAWKFNGDSFWQSERQIDSFQICNKPYKHLPMKSSNDPLPLPQIVIDTSKNPERNIFRTGYVEAVGSTMWLGDEFFSLTGASKEAVKQSDWLETTELKPGILKSRPRKNVLLNLKARKRSYKIK